MKELNICLCADINYYEPVVVTIASILENNKDMALHIYLISDDLLSEQVSYIRELIGLYSQKFTFFNQVDGIYQELKLTNHFTKAIYYRLSIPYLINKPKVLYLDSDIVVNGSLRSLCDIELGNNILGAIKDIGEVNRDKLGFLDDEPYFNSGVLLIDAQNWINFEVSKKVIDVLKNNHQNITYPDQDALNIVLKNNWLSLNPTYNQQACFFFKETQSTGNKTFGDDFHSVKKSAIIIHYSGGKKPWHTSNTHPFKSLYWQYLKKTKLYHKNFYDFSIKNLIAYYIKKILRIYY